MEPAEALPLGTEKRPAGLYPGALSFLSLLCYFTFKDVLSKIRLSRFQKGRQMADFTEEDLMDFFRESILPQMKLQIREELKCMLASSGAVDKEKVKMLCLAYFKLAGEKMEEYLREKCQPIFMFFSKKATNDILTQIINEINSEIPETHHVVMSFSENKKGVIFLEFKTHASPR